MMMRHLLAIGLCTGVICYPRPGVSASTDAPTDLPRSRICSVSKIAHVAGGAQIPARVTLNNDGRWCWLMLTTTLGGGAFGGPAHVTKQPSHGEVKIDVFQKATRIAYKPQPGFTGADEFRVVHELYNFEQQYIVTVQPDLGLAVVTRTVRAGTQVGVDHRAYLNPDCSFGGYADVRVRVPPQHGTLAIEPGEGYTSYPANNQRYDCNRQKSRLIEIRYAPATGYTGADEFELRTVWPNGTAVSTKYAITIE